MTHEEALNTLASIALRGGADPEVDHIEADNVLCALLADLGYSDVVDAFREIHKWYA